MEARGIKTILMIRDELNKENIECDICIEGKNANEGEQIYKITKTKCLKSLK